MILDRLGLGLVFGALLVGSPVPATEAAPAPSPNRVVFAGLPANDGRLGLGSPEGKTARLQEASPAPSADARGTSLAPPLAGVMSAVLPGSAQLAMGQRRGWIYLGVEAVSWFSYFALRSAGHQSEEDYQEFADLHWDWSRYETVSSCPGGGPDNFEEERAILQDLYQNDRSAFYEQIGDQDVYACGWETEVQRSDFLGQIDDADALFHGARYAVGAAFLNHLVSAVDAARSASRRRKTETMGSLRWEVKPSPGGPAVSVAMSRSF